MLDTYFVYNGYDSRDLDIYLQSPPEFSTPKPDVTTEKIAGKSGEALYWDGSYENVTGKIEAFQLSDDIATASRAFNFLQYNTGYHKLIVSDDPDVYRLAYISAGAKTNFRCGVVNPFTIKFSCYPQKYLTNGDNPIQITGTTTINNQWFDALPKIVVYGSGSGRIGIGSYAVSISSITSGMTLDCETMDAYYGTTNLNSKVTAQPYPKLVHGSNSISFSGGITSLYIYPRWWTL